jgi:hypothetical protein
VAAFIYGFLTEGETTDITKVTEEVITNLKEESKEAYFVVFSNPT